jgi:hypothetical protein
LFKELSSVHILQSQILAAFTGMVGNGEIQILGNAKRFGVGVTKDIVVSSTNQLWRMHGIVYLLKKSLECVLPLASAIYLPPRP